jgi:hypothetical protein
MKTVRMDSIALFAEELKFALWYPGEEEEDRITG